LEEQHYGSSRRSSGEARLDVPRPADVGQAAALRQEASPLPQTAGICELGDGQEASRLRGCFHILLLYDVAEAFDLEKIRDLLGPRGGIVKQAFPKRTPEYVRFEHAPIVEPSEPIVLSTGEQLVCSIKYYAYAVVVVQLEVLFDCDWSTLLSRSSRWVDAVDIEPRVREVVRHHLEQVAPAIIRPNEDWLQESYLLINLQQILQEGNGLPTANELLSAHLEEIVQLIRGESAPLSPRICEEGLQASLSYYSSDLVVVGSSAALVYDRSEDAAATNQVLEYAKMQLLEFRYYDTLMTQVLSDVYSALERKRNLLLSRWSLPRDAKRFNRIRLDVMELTERIDNAIKFVSDIYYARVYRLTATRIGVPDYRNLVEQKLRAVGELYDFMVDQFNQARSFVLEVGIAILALLDVILLLRGK
jgi:hypothetical protein